jgi:phosphomannomutase
MDVKDLKSKAGSKVGNIRIALEHRKTNGYLLLGMILTGILLLVVSITSWVRDSNRSRIEAATTGQVTRVINELAEANQLALQALGDKSKLPDLQRYLKGRMKEIDDARTFHGDVVRLKAADIGPNGFAVQDMLFDAQRGLDPPLQIHASLEPARLVDAVAIKRDDKTPGYLIVMVDPALLFSRFQPGELAAGYISLKQYNGRQAMTEFRSEGNPELAGKFPEVTPVPNTLFRIVTPQPASEILLTSTQRLIMIVIGILLLMTSLFLWRMNQAFARNMEIEREKRKTAKVIALDTLRDEGYSHPDSRPRVPDSTDIERPARSPDTKALPGANSEEKYETDDADVDDMAMKIKAMVGGSGLDTPLAAAESPGAEGFGLEPSEAERSVTDRSEIESPRIGQTESGEPDSHPSEPGGSVESGIPASGNMTDADPPRMHLRYDIQERRRKKKVQSALVELDASIFRAYDIRGIVGKTLDRGIAKQVGQVLGTMVLELDAGPLVIARDGRLSGPDLVDGMTEGALSSGCDVLDIGAVPTGVLYYAAFEMASGSGVMITGSHNPPDYNGFKVMVAGDTLFGDQITRMYDRICKGDVRVGRGTVSHADVLDQYRERIVSDIKLERPLKVIIDCGNGIGGVCAAEVLRAVGAEVVPMFDEVDGTFPNHHPDPSDPDNLVDLIDSVRMMNADLGLALDGDADRLGVVTLGGSIIYSDRVMMLLALDVLDRMPGATIIYDVKCTGHLAKVIEEAGGNPVMYKTGHSLIKARMKEIGSPFAGEMSGHFFFGERWYGVDDGIYAACRLLEILSGTDTPPEAILNALPTSFSTPELKVEMSEGENHVFIEAFQLKARFEGATINTIDGVRADFADGWGLVRASNTTPILVVRFDAESEQSLERIKNVFRQQMMSIQPTLKLPF